MITKKDVERVYEDLYKIAEKLGDPFWTESIFRVTRLQLTNPGLSPGIERRRKLSEIATPVSRLYQYKFERLEDVQKRVQEGGID